MQIRVLHVFAPSLRTRFGGPAYYWKGMFERWDAPDVNHLALDVAKGRILEAREALSFEYPRVQLATPRAGRLVWAPFLLRNLARWKYRFDALHVHVLWWGSLLIGPWSKRAAVPAMYESVLEDSDTPAALQRESLGSIKVRCLRAYRAILALTDHLGQEYVESGFPPSAVHTLRSCVDTRLFAPAASIGEKSSIRARMSLPPDGTLLLFAGSVVARKGIDLLIRAFIAACRRDPGLRLVVVGPATKAENPTIDEELVARMHGLLHDAGMAGRVNFVGLVDDRDRLSNLFRASDILVFPSVREGLPNVVLEAMASGLPIIASRLPGLEPMLRQNVNALLVPIGDPDALAESVLKLSRDHKLARQLGVAAREYAVSEHGFEKWQSELVGIYRGLVG